MIPAKGVRLPAELPGELTLAPEGEWELKTLVVVTRFTFDTPGGRVEALMRGLTGERAAAIWHQEKGWKNPEGFIVDHGRPAALQFLGVEGLKFDLDGSVAMQAPPAVPCGSLLQWESIQVTGRSALHLDLTIVAPSYLISFRTAQIMMTVVE